MTDRATARMIELDEEDELIKFKKTYQYHILVRKTPTPPPPPVFLSLFRLMNKQVQLLVLIKVEPSSTLIDVAAGQP
jgi:hypothetical protein